MKKINKNTEMLGYTENLISYLKGQNDGSSLTKEEFVNALKVEGDSIYEKPFVKNFYKHFKKLTINDLSKNQITEELETFKSYNQRKFLYNILPREVFINYFFEDLGELLKIFNLEDSKALKIKILENIKNIFLKQKVEDYDLDHILKAFSISKRFSKYNYFFSSLIDVYLINNYLDLSNLMNDFESNNYKLNEDIIDKIIFSFKNHSEYKNGNERGLFYEISFLLRNFADNKKVINLVIDYFNDNSIERSQKVIEINYSIKRFFEEYETKNKKIKSYDKNLKIIKSNLFELFVVLSKYTELSVQYFCRDLINFVNEEDLLNFVKILLNPVVFDFNQPRNLFKLAEFFEENIEAQDLIRDMAVEVVLRSHPVDSFHIGVLFFDKFKDQRILNSLIEDAKSKEIEFILKIKSIEYFLDLLKVENNVYYEEVIDHIKKVHVPKINEFSKDWANFFIKYC